MKNFSLAILLVCSSFAFGQTETILHSFTKSQHDGATPIAGLAFDASGNLYGTTSAGGFNGTGVVYEITPSQTESIIYNFVGSQSNGPQVGDSGLIADAAGNFYGTTQFGGDYQNGQNGGTAFKMIKTAAGFNLKVIAGFTSAPASPHGVTFDASGNLWGASIGESGCHHSGASIWALTPSSGMWKIVVEHGFGCNLVGQVGKTPVGVLAMDASGNFYGATSAGSATKFNGLGTVYEFNPTTNQLSYLVSFLGANGSTPAAGVILDAQGNLYGTTSAGGAFNDGTVFELSPNGQGGWTETVLFSFNGSNGQTPGALTFDADGNLFGVTTSGGTSGGGTVFELSPSGDTWTETVLWNFGGQGDGMTPAGALIFDSLGNLYGVTSAGGANGVGTVFEVTP